ncbi:hypothetical protein [Burkholderia territorii]|uniref:hypothetical protein n=1 Tax=Burkholderia territorii TaxID=1503055 RepID=UPI000A609FED|nr:hypothetical protein [Burkholderia territorii]
MVKNIRFVFFAGLFFTVCQPVFAQWVVSDPTAESALLTNNIERAVDAAAAHADAILNSSKLGGIPIAVASAPSGVLSSSVEYMCTKLPSSSASDIAAMLKLCEGDFIKNSETTDSANVAVLEAQVSAAVAKRDYASARLAAATTQFGAAQAAAAAGIANADAAIANATAARALLVQDRATKAKKAATTAAALALLGFIAAGAW